MAAEAPITAKKEAYSGVLPEDMAAGPGGPERGTERAGRERGINSSSVTLHLTRPRGLGAASLMAGRGDLLGPVSEVLWLRGEKLGV